MEDMYKLIGSPVGHHGTYAFYKALKISRNDKEHIIAIGDFFFVRLWQDSELLAIGELQLLWTDRGAGRTLASLRLYFLPENTPAGRSHHGEDEVVGISERVVIRAEDLLSWVCEGSGWRWGLPAPWSGDCIPIPAATSPSPNAPPPLPTSRKLDFSDIDKEKSLILDSEAPAVVVFSYPRYCRYRAMLRRLDGIAQHWLHDPLVAALGGYSAPTKNTKILYCKETFEYPELEGHEFVCNHMAPKLRGRQGRGRKRRARSASHSSASDSSASHNRASTPQGLKVGLRSSAPSPHLLQVSVPSHSLSNMAEDRAFVQRLRVFHKFNKTPLDKLTSLGSKKLKLRQLYDCVVKDGGFEEVTRANGWKKILAEIGVPPSHSTITQRQYERFLLSFERSEKLGLNTHLLSSNGTSSNSNSPIKLERKKHLSITNSIPIATIDISDSPIRELSNASAGRNAIPRLRTPPPGKRKSSSHKKMEKMALLNGDKGRSDIMRKRGHHSLLNKHRSHEKNKHKIKMHSIPVYENNINSFEKEESEDEITPEHNFDPSNLLNLNVSDSKCDDSNDYINLTKGAADLNQEFLDSLPKPENMDSNVEEKPRNTSAITPEKVNSEEPGLGFSNPAMNGTSNMTGIDKPSPVRSRPSSLRSVRVKPDRRQGAQAASPPGAPSLPPPLPPSQPSTGPPSDDDLIEVPYKPKSPEIIDLDLYESPDSPLSTKRKKLDILKKGGLEVTTVHNTWPGLNPAFQQQILNKASLFTMYGALALGQNDAHSPPKVTQGKSIYGSSSPEKTVYGNPKDPFMPPPHMLQGVAPRKVSYSQRTPSAVDILDLTIKPSVEIMRVPGLVEMPQNLTAKKPPCPNNEPRQINPALEITLVAKNKPPRTPQKRTSSGKFMSNKHNAYVNSVPNIPSLIPRNKSMPLTHKNNVNHHAGANLVIPNYQVSSTSNIGSVSPGPNTPLGTNITSSFLQGAGGTLLQMATATPKSSGLGPMSLTPMLDNSLYMSALYSSLAGPLTPGITDQHKFAHMYNEIVSGTILGRYPGIATAPGVVATPTSKS